MADDEELNPENLSPVAWERIQLPSLVNHFQSQSPVIVLSDPHGGGGRWSTPTVCEDISYIWNCSVIRGGLFRSFCFPLVGSTVVLLLFWLIFRLRLRLRSRLRRKAVDELLSTIKKKDERIHQLLYQIARMNELLLGTDHRVPMISKVASG